jgi:galactokinase
MLSILLKLNFISLSLLSWMAACSIMNQFLSRGGFGGCTVALVKKDASQELMEYLMMQYEAKTGLKCVCFETAPAGGAKAIDLV